MSRRGRELFDMYVTVFMASPEARDGHPETHVANLLATAEDARVEPSEMIEEVGDVLTALRHQLRQPQSR